MAGTLRSRLAVSFHFLVDNDFYKNTVASVIYQFVRTSPKFNSQHKSSHLKDGDFSCLEVTRLAVTR